MNMTRIRLCYRAIAVIALITVLIVASTRLRADTGTCGGESVTLPFTDVPSSNVFFCSIAAAYFSGLSNGTSATTYSPTANVTREQMAAFVSRTLDQSLRRSRRAALDQFWTPRGDDVPTTPVGHFPVLVKSDGADLWVANRSSGTVSRVRASDGRLLETWTGAGAAYGVLVARGRIYVTGGLVSGRLYSLNPTQPAGPVTLVADQLGDQSIGIAFDGARIWTTNIPGSVSIIRFSLIPACNPCVTTITEGFVSPIGILYDGSHIWVADRGDNMLKRLNSDGSIAHSVPVPGIYGGPAFDGTNIWVPLNGPRVQVVRVKDTQGNPLAEPFLLAQLTGNGLDRPEAAAFDGQRILVTNFDGDSVSLWKAADLTPLGSFSLLPSPFSSPVHPYGACSDGVNFWVTLQETDRLARF